MRRFLLKIVISGAAIFLVVRLLPWAEVEDPAALVATALLLAIFNSFVRPLLILLTLPINILSFGLFILVINGLILYAVAILVPGFEIKNFAVAVLASIMISIAAGAINWLIRGADA